MHGTPCDMWEVARTVRVAVLLFDPGNIPPVPSMR